MERLLNPPALVRVALAAFVLAWLFGPDALRSTVPIWLVFAIAVALEVQFFVAGLRATPERDPPDRGPQAVDRERYGYDADDFDDDWDDHEDDGDLEDEGEVELVPDRPSPTRRLLVGLGVVVALALVLVLWVDSRSGWAGLGADARARAASRFSAEASRIAAKPVTVRCDESGRHVGAVQHADGAAVVGGEVAYLTPERCLDLYRLAFRHTEASSRTGRAIAVLAHEAWHLRGISDEGTTECYALQSGVGLGERLGLSEDTARRMMQQQLVENAGRTGAGTEYVVPPDCRNGGTLDLDPASDRFP